MADKRNLAELQMEARNEPEAESSLNKVFLVFSDRNHVDYIENLKYHIQEVLKERKFQPVTLGGNIPSMKEYFTKLKEFINQSVLGIVILDGFRPNVILELGYLLAKGKPVICFITKGAEFCIKTLYGKKGEGSGLTSKQFTKDLRNPQIDLNCYLSDLKSYHLVIFPDRNNPVEIRAIVKEALDKQLADINQERTNMMRPEAKAIEIPENYDKLMHELYLAASGEKKLNEDKLKELITEIENLVINNNINLAPNYYLAALEAWQALALREKAEQYWKMLLTEAEKTIAIFEERKVSSFAASGYGVQGNAWYQLKDYDRALSTYQQAVELKPDLIEVWNNLGNTLHQLNRNEEAITAFNQAIELKPDYAEARYNLGNTLADLDRKEEAIVAYNQAIELKPDFFEAWYNLGCTLADLNRKKAAFQKAVELKPDDAKAWFNLGMTRFGLLNNPAKVKEAWQTAQKLSREQNNQALLEKIIFWLNKFDNPPKA